MSSIYSRFCYYTPAVLCFWVLLLSVWLPSCGSKETPQTPPPLATDSLPRDSADMTHPTKGHPILLVVSTQQASIRLRPSLSAPEIYRAAQGDSLVYTNMVTDFAIAMQIDGIEHQAPWLRVALPDNRMGWLYGGTVRFDGLSHAELSELVFDQRLRQIFGAATAESLIGYRTAGRDIQTPTAFHLQWEQSEDLRQQIEAKIEQKLQFMDTTQAVPDFFWLNDVFSGFVTAFFRDTRRYELFRDFRYWHQLATQTTTPADDSLVAVFLAAYPTDSLEFTAGDWAYPIPDQAPCSRLGEGIHLQIIRKANTVYTQNPEYLPYLKPLLRQLLDDISLSTAYWQSLPDILRELDALLAAPYPVLSPSDKIELKARRQMLQKAADNGIRLHVYEQGI